VETWTKQAERDEPQRCGVVSDPLPSIRHKQLRALAPCGYITPILLSGRGFIRTQYIYIQIRSNRWDQSWKPRYWCDKLLLWCQNSKGA
jgi:hypothetical protein